MSSNTSFREDLIQHIRDLARTDPVWTEFMNWARQEQATVRDQLVTARDPVTIHRLQGKDEVWRRLLQAPDEMVREIKAERDIT